MKISKEQLKIWSSQQSIDLSKKTHQQIENTLAVILPSFHEKYQMFLQGSYKNCTNIHAESDVDIILMRQDCFIYNTPHLTNDHQHQLLFLLRNQSLRALNYGYKSDQKEALNIICSSKREIYNSLIKKYKNNIKVASKAITILSDTCLNRRKADLIIAIPYRLYTSSQYFYEGICFHNRKENKLHINFPKQHSKCLTEKHQETNNIFKPTIRICKNFCKYLMVKSKGVFTKNLVSSYNIECMIYNVPSESFENDLEENIISCLRWIQNAAINEFVCANRLHWLFKGESSWNVSKCKLFVNTAIDLVAPKVH